MRRRVSHWDLEILAELPSSVNSGDYAPCIIPNVVVKSSHWGEGLFVVLTYLWIPSFCIPSLICYNISALIRTTAIRGSSPNNTAILHFRDRGR